MRKVIVISAACCMSYIQIYNWPEVLCFFRVVFITFCTFSTISFLDASQLANTMSIKTVNRSWSSAGRGPSSLLFMLLLPVIEELIISSVVNSFLKTLSTIFDRGSLGLTKDLRSLIVWPLYIFSADLVAASDSATTELPFPCHGFVPLFRFFNFFLIFETSHFSCSTSSFNF